MATRANWYPSSETNCPVQSSRKSRETRRGVRSSIAARTAARARRPGLGSADDRSDRLVDHPVPVIEQGILDRDRWKQAIHVPEGPRLDHELSLLQASA